MLGGVIVGMTSVGSGSLMIVMLLFLYPALGASQLVGTDLTQAVPLTLAAALGALAFGHVAFGVTASLMIGSVPAVVIGSLISSSAPDRYVRPAITFVIFASGLKYVGLGTTALGWVLVATLLVGAGLWVYVAHPGRNVSVPRSRLTRRRRLWRRRRTGRRGAGSGGRVPVAPDQPVDRDPARYVANPGKERNDDQAEAEDAHDHRRPKRRHWGSS